MEAIDDVGLDWLLEKIDQMDDGITIIDPVSFNEKNRYLPAGVSPRPGFIRYDLFPYLKEIINNFDPRSPVRECNLLKGVQVGYTTLLESIMLYYIAHIKTQPMMFITADKELATSRIENNILPMINESDMSHLIRSADEGNSRKTGKALSIDTPIPTPDGFIIMGDLKIGDHVYAPDGSVTTIVSESPIHERFSYEIEFANGETIVASDDHRWVVNVRGSTRKWQVLTTAKMHKKGIKCNATDYRYRVAVTAPVSGGSNVTLPIKPYTFGAWLGDGSSQDPYLAVGESGKPLLNQILNDGYSLKQYKTASNKCDLYAIKSEGKPVRSWLTSLNLIGNKHIPDIYLSASLSDRISLLQGLMDTDGCCGKKGECEITQKNKRLAHDIWCLVNSLGYKATLRHKIARSQNGTESTVYRINFFASEKLNPFRLEYKRERVKEKLHPRSIKNTIKRITPLGVRSVKCIGVSHPSETYLCGRGYIPTHNTKDYIQWEGGGFMIPQGAMNAAKMRQYSVPLMLKDELDGWKREVGNDGNSDALTDARLSAYWSVRKILRGSTPLLRPSLMEDAFNRGDKRKYNILCRKCSFPQDLRMENVDKETGVIGGFQWDLDDRGILILESVRYCCINCGHEHFERDKEYIFATEHGAHWEPTAQPHEAGIRSYHLPAWYSPFGFRPWSKGVADYIEAYNPKTKETKSVGKLQTFYNNTLGVPFEVRGAKINFTAVSAHRRAHYKMGQIDNEFALKHSGSEILFLTCTVDVHKRNLAVSVFGWCRGMISYLIDYWRFERKTDEDDCAEITSPVWARLRELISEKVYTANCGRKYRVLITLIDASYSTDTVVDFCSTYESNVFPVMGRDRTAKYQTIKEFAEFKTSAGTVGYRILVDHYKDRIAPVMRREWYEDQGPQKSYHWNAPVDTTDKQIKEMTVETRREKTDERGNVSYVWHRPGNAANELWDLTVYSHAAVEIVAYQICMQYFELTTVDWSEFWTYVEENRDFFAAA